jgi:ribosomal protein S18 acetylase RimI-like enzyme
MKNELYLRSYQHTDCDNVVRLWQQCGLVVPWNDPQADIARKMNVDQDLFIVGECANRVVATVMGGYEGHRGWINYLAVAPDMQRNGYGRAVMAEVEKRLGAKGCPKVNLQVRTRNKDVIHFYQSFGYKVDDVISLGKRINEE